MEGGVGERIERVKRQDDPIVPPSEKGSFVRREGKKKRIESAASRCSTFLSSSFPPSLPLRGFILDFFPRRLLHSSTSRHCSVPFEANLISSSPAVPSILLNPLFFFLPVLSSILPTAKAAIWSAIVEEKRGQSCNGIGKPLSVTANFRTPTKRRPFLSFLRQRGKEEE